MIIIYYKNTSSTWDQTSHVIISIHTYFMSSNCLLWLKIINHYNKYNNKLQFIFQIRAVWTYKTDKINVKNTIMYIMY